MRLSGYGTEVALDCALGLGTLVSGSLFSNPIRVRKTVSTIEIDRSAGDDVLDQLGVRDWPIWEKETSVFPWHYDTRETCYLLAGHVIVTPDGGTPVHLGPGDLVTFPSGLSCTWEIREPVRKHYRFG